MFQITNHLVDVADYVAFQRIRIQNPLETLAEHQGQTPLAHRLIDVDPI